MKTKVSKVLILLFTLATLHLAEACWMKTGDCDCPSVSPYFDYNSVTAEVNDPAKDYFLELDLLPADLQFLTDASVQERGFGLNTAALACDCAEKGDNGDKFPFKSFTITAGENWNSDYPAGTSLNELFMLFQRDGVVIQALPLPESNFPGFGSWTRKTILKNFFLPDNPEQEFHFLITIEKMNGQIVKVKVPAVKWK